MHTKYHCITLMRMSRHLIPLRSGARRRDRHGRGVRGPVVPPTLPAWRTRSDRFDQALAAEISAYRRIYGHEMSHLDFGVLEVPEHDPAPWEHGVPLARFLPFERPAKITGRIVFYRMPILHAARREPDPTYFLHLVVTEQLAAALGRSPEDFDYLR